MIPKTRERFFQALSYPANNQISALFDSLVGIGKRLPRPKMLTRLGYGFKQGLRIALLVGTDKHTLAAEFLKQRNEGPIFFSRHLGSPF